MARPRPPVEPLGEVFATSSFPSGHVGSAITLFGGIAVAVVWHLGTTGRRPGRGHAGRRRRRGRARRAVVAFSRVWGGHHHVSDVVWGALLGSTWLTLSWWLVLRPGDDALVGVERR